MLKIKRRKSHTIRTTIPAPESTDVQKAVEAVTSSVNPSKALAAIRPTKLFIKAKINGSSDTEAKALAGISNATRTAAIFKNPVSQLILEEVLSHEDDFSDPGIVKRLKEMWHAKEQVYIPVGEHVVKRKKPNWDVRKFAFTNVLELRGYKGKKDDAEKLPQATEIHFHVSEVPKMQKPIDVDAVPE